MAATEGQERIRPWHRLRNWFLAAAALVLATLAWMYMEVRAVQHAKPNPSVDYRAEFRDVVKKHVQLGPDEGAQAWQTLMAALDLMDEELAAITLELESQDDFQPRSEYDFPAPDFDYVRYGDVIPTDAQRERRAIERLRERGVMDQLALFVEQAPGYNAKVPDGMIFSGLPQHLSSTRTLTQARMASLRFAQADGDWSEVIRAVEETLAVGHTIALQPGGINALVGMANHGLVMQDLRSTLFETSFDIATCQALLYSLDRWRLPDTAFFVTGEQMVVDDIMQHLFTDNGRGNGYLVGDANDFGFATPGGQGTFVGAFFSRFVLASRRETQLMFDEAFDGLIAETELPLEQRGSIFDREAFVENLSFRYKLVEFVLPALDFFLRSVEREEASREATRLMLALAMYSAEHGEFPSSLDALVPDILPELPRDPLHGGPFGYRLLESDAHDRPYLLYTFGVDGIDNDGKEDEDRPSHALQDGKGLDHVYNRPRDPWPE